VERGAFLAQRPDPLPRGRYWRTRCLYARRQASGFVEELDPRTGRGHIAVLEVLGTRLVGSALRCASRSPLSFPLLFEHQGSSTCARKRPPAREAARLPLPRVFRCAGQLAQVVLRDVSAADPLLFEKWRPLVACSPISTRRRRADQLLGASTCLGRIATAFSTTMDAAIRRPAAGRLDSADRNGGLIMDGGKCYRLASARASIATAKPARC